MESLTRRQMDVLNYIAEVHSARGTSPTLREIASAFSVCVASVQKYLRALARKGYVSVDTYTRRGIRLTRSRREWKVRQALQGEFDRRIGAKLKGETDLPRIFAIVREDVRAWIDVGAAELFVNEAHQRGLRGREFYEVSAGAPANPAVLPGGEPDEIVAQAFRRRKPVVDPGRKPRGAAAVPIPGRDRVLGVLRLEDHRPEVFDETRITRAAMAAASLAPALEQGVLQAELQRRIRLQAALVQLCRTIDSVRDFQKVLREVHAVVSGLVDAVVFLIAVKDDRGRWWMLLESDTVDGKCIESSDPRPITIGHTEALDAIRSAPYWIRHRTPEEIRALESEGAKGDRYGLNPLGHKQKRSRSILYVPLRSGGEMIGYLSAQSYAYNAYTLQDAEDLILVGEYIGMAAQNALREELDRELEARGRLRLRRLDRLERELEELSEKKAEEIRPRLQAIAKELAGLRATKADAGRLLTGAES